MSAGALDLALPRVPPLPQILLFGDSLTEFGGQTTHGWGLHLSRLFVRRADVLNRGLAGYNTRWCRSMFLEQAACRLLPTPSPSTSNPPTPSPSTNCAGGGSFLFSTLLLGSNDAAAEGSPQSVPVPEYEENLWEISKWLLAQSAHGLLICTPPPVHEEKWALQGKGRRENAHIWQYRLAAMRVGERLRKELASEVVLVAGAGTGSGNANCTADTVSAAAAAEGCRVPPADFVQAVGPFGAEGPYLPNKMSADLHAVVSGGSTCTIADGDRARGGTKFLAIVDTWGVLGLLSSSGRPDDVTDACPAFGDQENRRLDQLLNDGLHFAEEADLAFLKAIYGILETQGVAAVRMAAPYWHDLERITRLEATQTIEVTAKME